MPKKKRMLKKKRRVKRKKLKFKKKDKKIFISILLFIGLILSIFVYFNYEKMLENSVINNVSKETNLTQIENETKHSQENVSRVPENVIIIGKGGRIKIVGE